MDSGLHGRSSDARRQACARYFYNSHPPTKDAARRKVLERCVDSAAEHWLELQHAPHPRHHTSRGTSHHYFVILGSWVVSLVRSCRSAELEAAFARASILVLNRIRIVTVFRESHYAFQYSTVRSRSAKLLLRTSHGPSIMNFHTSARAIADSSEAVV